MRSFPFYFSGTFFLAFGLLSLGMIPVYFLLTSHFLTVIALDAGLLVAALVDWRLAPANNQILCNRPVPFPLAARGVNEISLEVTNLADRAVRLIVADDVPPRCEAPDLPLHLDVEPRGLVRTTYRLIPAQRGNGEFGDIYHWVRGPLGLVWRRGRSTGGMTVKIYPGLALVQEQGMRVWRPVVQEALRSYWKRGVGTEFDSLREYVVGDDPRLIHWSTTARTGRVIVRQNRVERSQTIFLVIDAGRMMTARVKGRTKMDYGLDAALLVAFAALELGDRVGLMVAAQDVLCFLPPAGSPAQFGRLLDATYALEPRLEEPRYYMGLGGLAARLKRRSLVIVFTDLIDERASQGLARYSLALSPRHLPLVVAMTDTEVVNMADSTPAGEEDLYRQGIAAGMLHRRGKLLARLVAGGVMVLDAPPDKLSVGALEQYLAIKTRAKL